MRETWVQSLGWEDPLEKGKAIFLTLQRVRHDWVTFTFTLGETGQSFPGGSAVRICLHCRSWNRGLTPGWEDSFGGGHPIHSSILAWRIPWTEDPGKLQSIGLQSQVQLKRLSMHTLRVDWWWVFPFSRMEGQSYWICVLPCPQIIGCANTPAAWTLFNLFPLRAGLIKKNRMKIFQNGSFFSSPAGNKRFLLYLLWESVLTSWWWISQYCGSPSQTPLESLALWVVCPEPPAIPRLEFRSSYPGTGSHAGVCQESLLW